MEVVIKFNMNFKAPDVNVDKQLQRVVKATNLVYLILSLIYNDSKTLILIMALRKMPKFHLISSRGNFL